VYDVRDYDAMFADGARTRSYLAAIDRAVRPGSVVVEIGTGAGFFAVAACRAGARRVYAIETNPIIALAADVARDNGCADRITFIHGDSRSASVAERGDVLLSDLRGVLPLLGDHIPTIADARSRLVCPGATLVPRRDSLWAAPCAAPEDWRLEHVAPGDAPHGIDRRAVAARVRSDWVKCRLNGGDLAGAAVQWGALDYATVESPNIAGRAEWTFDRDAAPEGLALWFDGDLGFGETISNSPRAPSALYGQAFFPFERALIVRAGDRLTVELSATLIEGEYCWSWSSTLTPALAGAQPVSFRQNSLTARVGSLERLRELAAAANGAARHRT
jgi:protein arginine N-methyltransferase 1